MKRDSDDKRLRTIWFLFLLIGFILAAMVDGVLTGKIYQRHSAADVPVAEQAPAPKAPQAAMPAPVQQPKGRMREPSVTANKTAPTSKTKTSAFKSAAATPKTAAATPKAAALTPKSPTASAHAASASRKAAKAQKAAAERAARRRRLVIEWRNSHGVSRSTEAAVANPANSRLVIEWKGSSETAKRP